jgi:CubicO group peptidase (beta-lactamase class C family)
MRAPTLTIAALLSAATLSAQSPHLQKTVDSIVTEALKDGRAAGMTIAVVRGSDTLVLKGYGHADLEFDVPTPPRAIYEIGSITKQFTSASILLLQEEGKLSLDDDIRKHLPDYPTYGYRIPLRRLMDHTSGIKGYTELADFQRISTRKLPKDSLVAIFKNRPYEFAPGDALVYNNSAYFLLGLVIEKLTGMPYGDFVKARLFDKAGMKDSYYCSENAVVKRRAHGYEMSPKGLVRASFIDHTYPYAAGSLCASAVDLVAWNQALHGGKILKPESYQALITPESLNDGTKVRYAKGIVPGELAGRRSLRHGGGIPGFLSDNVYFPDDRTSIVVLVNSAGPVAPDEITNQVAAALYSPPPAPGSGAAPSDLSAYTGEYRGVGRGQPLVLKTTVENGALMIQTGTGRPRQARFAGNDTFEVGNGRYTFIREGGKVAKVRADLVSVNSLLTRS